MNRRLRYLNDWIVAYLVPGPLWRSWRRFPYWHRWYWRSNEVMCVACGRGYQSRPFHREHGCGAY